MIVAVLAGSAEAITEDLRALDVRRASVTEEVAAEVRLDLMDTPDIGVFRRAPVPLIATCRRPRDGGRFRGSEAERFDLLRRAAEAGARWVDVEYDALGSLPSRGPADVIASIHDFEATPADLPALVSALLTHEVAYVKVATRIRALLDIMTLAQAARQAPGRVILVGLSGAAGAARVLADRAGSPWLMTRFSTHGATPPPELALAGVPAFDDLVEFLRGGSFERTIPAYAVVGDRADESIGPLVFNRTFRDHGIAGTYVHLKTGSLAGLRETCRLLNIRGLSVTTPFKEAVLAAADRIEPSAAGLGAANTLVVDEGAWVAWNTDQDGIAAPVAERLRVQGRVARGMAALVVGAGGMGRAAASALRGLGLAVTMTSRGRERLNRAAELLGVERVAAEDAGRRRWDVVVNATPAGSTRDPSGRAVDPAWVAGGGILVETNYRPLVTPLAREARALGLDVVTGDAVYAAQAAAQLALFRPGAGDLGDAIGKATTWAIESTASF